MVETTGAGTLPIGTPCLKRLVTCVKLGLRVAGAGSGPDNGSIGGGSLIEIDDELPESVRNADSWEEMSKRWVESSRGAISWVFTAGDISCDKSALVSICDAVDATEHLVGFPISTPSLPPAFDDSSIVTKDPEVLACRRLADCAESVSKKLEANCFSPSDVPSICFPPWDETPGAPLVADANT